LCVFLERRQGGISLFSLVMDTSSLSIPLVEYASAVWNPYTKTEINKIEAVQRRAARYVVTNQRNRSSVSNMLQRLKWRPLSNRRKDARLMMVNYK
jgi:hypothetical protein